MNEILKGCVLASLRIACRITITFEHKLTLDESLVGKNVLLFHSLF